MDIECRHARNRRAERGGRPPDFASMAARCFLRECTTLHAQVTGHLPQHHHRARMARAKRAVGLADPERRTRTVANPFFAFRHEREAAWKAAHCGSNSGPGPRTREWEQQVAADWARLKETMPERQLAYATRAKERNAALAGQPPRKRCRKACPPLATVDTTAALTDSAPPGHDCRGATTSTAIAHVGHASRAVVEPGVVDQRASHPGQVVLRGAQLLRSARVPLCTGCVSLLLRPRSVASCGVRPGLQRPRHVCRIASLAD